MRMIKNSPLINGKIIFLSISSCHILFEDRNLKLITLQDVTSELAAKEAESWHKLLRVLTHEISNSAIPLSTLSSYIQEVMLKAYEDDKELTLDQRQDVMMSLKTIDQRSRTLKEFVHNFRMVGQVPEPMLVMLNAKEIVEGAIHLFSKELEKENVHYHFHATENIFIYADRNLTQQVLINLLKNAMEAMAHMKDRKFIDIKLTKESGRGVNIFIRDSGTGISPDDIEQIFVPFFSTKKGGSGIGLSISKQIMQKQRGDITVESEIGKGSLFALSFTC
jgi:two-component system nitrogen regulation sensor histidine kinase NtrY